MAGDSTNLFISQIKVLQEANTAYKSGDYNIAYVGLIGLLLDCDKYGTPPRIRGTAHFILASVFSALSRHNEAALHFYNASIYDTQRFDTCVTTSIFVGGKFHPNVCFALPST